MNVNSIYKNEIIKTPDITTETAEKETESIAAEYCFRETKSSQMADGAVTYEDELLKSSEGTSKKEDKEIFDDKELWKKNSDRMTEEDYKELSEEGMTLEKYNAERLDRALTRIKKQRTAKDENLEKKKEDIEDDRESIRKITYSGISKKIAEKLMESDLPVTDETVSKVENAMGMAAASIPVTDKAMNYLIKNKLEPTIENIYKAQYSGNSYQGKGISEETWNSLKDQVYEIIDNSGLEISEESDQSAKWLLNNRLPLTEDTLWKLQNLKQINNGINEEELLNKTIDTMMSGNSPESALVGDINIKKVEQVVTAFQSISDEVVDLLVGTQLSSQQNQTEYFDKINCRMLRKAQIQLNEQKNSLENNKKSILQEGNLKSEQNNTSDNGLFAENIDIQAITAKRQLEEIRLKMTIEAGQQLTKNGFRLDTDSLSKIVEGLRELEDHYYKSLLQESNAPVNSENISTLKISLSGIEELKSMPSYVLGSTLAERRTVTVNGLLETGTECKQILKAANQSYEALMTSPRADMGDSILKAFRNVDDILNDMGLETTRANQRAVRILGYNQMGITEDNINRVKAYDGEVNYLIDNLHPAVTVELIKQGINPVDTPVQELNQQINLIKDQIGASEEEKYSKYLWKLEKDKSITEEEKQSYIGIYRLLNSVEKTDGAALGAVVKANQEVTMNNLLTAVRTIKGRGIHAEVNDSFGILENISFTRERISDQIAAAFEAAPRTEQLEKAENSIGSQEEIVSYHNRLLGKLREEVSPGKLKALGNMDDIMNLSLERLQESIQDSPEKGALEQEYWSKNIENYRNTMEQSETALKFLKDYNIPSSINNIQAANDVINKDQSLYKQWKAIRDKQNQNTDNIEMSTYTAENTELDGISEGLINSLKNQESMIDQYETAEQTIKQQMNLFYESKSITSQDIASIQRINNGLSFVQLMAKRESYEIPMAIGDKITSVNVTFIRNTNETGKVDINIQSDTFGKITAGFSVKNLALNGLITCDNRFGLEALQSESQNLKDAVNGAGFEMKQINYGIDNRTMDVYRSRLINQKNTANSDKTDNVQETSTDTLYTLAKTLLIQIREMELKHAE